MTIPSFAPSPELLNLLLDQGRYDDADAYVDRCAARIDYEIRREREDRCPSGCPKCAAEYLDRADEREAANSHSVPSDRSD